MSATSRNSLMRAKLAQHLLQKAKGFTLIELLVVIVIVGVLSAVAIPTFLNQIRRARTAEAQAALSEVSRASEAFRLDYGEYPVDGATYTRNPRDTTSTFTCAAAYDCIGSGLENDTLYMQDPFTTKAPNYFDPIGESDAATAETQIVWGTTANTAIAKAYKAGGTGGALQCIIGVGNGTADPQVNIDQGCNLKDGVVIATFAP